MVVGSGLADNLGAGDLILVALYEHNGGYSG